MSPLSNHFCIHIIEPSLFPDVIKNLWILHSNSPHPNYISTFLSSCCCPCPHPCQHPNLVALITSLLSCPCHHLIHILASSSACLHHLFLIHHMTYLPCCHFVLVFLALPSPPCHLIFIISQHSCHLVVVLVCILVGIPTLLPSSHLCCPVHVIISSASSHIHMHSGLL